MEDRIETNEFPLYWDFLKRREISRGTALLTTEDRNKLLNEKCIKIYSLMRRFNPGNRGHLFGRIKA